MKIISDDTQTMNNLFIDIIFITCLYCIQNLYNESHLKMCLQRGVNHKIESI